MTVCERVFRDLKFALPSSRVRCFKVTQELVADPVNGLKRLLAGARKSVSSPAKSISQSGPDS